MKEKLKKTLDTVFSWRWLKWIAIGFAIFYLTIFLFTEDPAVLLYVGNHIAFACLSYAGENEREAVKRACQLAATYKFISDRCMDLILRYQKLYGELPPEEENTAAVEESEKKNSENA